MQDGLGGQWQRCDDFGIDQLASHGHYGQTGPALNGLPHWEHVSLYAFACHFLPMHYISEMAASMTSAGRAKHAAGLPGYASWAVTLDDLMQWLG
eukprot:3054770-Pleurochrysis_carterae.AAC.1